MFIDSSELEAIIDLTIFNYFNVRKQRKKTVFKDY